MTGSNFVRLFSPGFRKKSDDKIARGIAPSYEATFDLRFVLRTAKTVRYNPDPIGA